jgi:ankyrin repeat protein
MVPLAYPPHRHLRKQGYLSFECAFNSERDLRLIQNIHIMGRSLLYSPEVTQCYKALKEKYLSGRTTLKNGTGHHISSHIEMLAFIRLMNRDHARHLKQGLSKIPNTEIQPGYTTQDILVQAVHSKKFEILTRTVMRTINIGDESVAIHQTTSKEGSRTDMVQFLGEDIKGGPYDEIIKTIQAKKNHTEREIAHAILNPFDPNLSQELKTLGANLYVLLMLTEGARNNAALITHVMVLQLIEKGALTFDQALSAEPGCRFPMRGSDAVRNTQWFEATFMSKHSLQTTWPRYKKVDTNYRKSMGIFKDEWSVTQKWLEHFEGQLWAKFTKVKKLSRLDKAKNTKYWEDKIAEEDDASGVDEERVRDRVVETIERKYNDLKRVIEDAVITNWTCTPSPVDEFKDKTLKELTLDEQTKLFSAIENLDLGYVKNVLVSGVDLRHVVQTQGYSLLSYAIVKLDNSREASEILRLLILNPSIDKNDGGKTEKYDLPSPLITAIRMGKTDVAIRLINMGANINLGFQIKHMQSPPGCAVKKTPQIFTPQYFEDQKAVIIKGFHRELVNVDLCTSDFELEQVGYTPLHFAAAMLNVDLCKALINLGANRQAKGPDGESIYDLAEILETELRHNEAVYWDVNARDKPYRRLKEPQQQKRREITELLKQEIVDLN